MPLLSLFAAGLFAAQANAAIIIQFKEIGGNVVATTTGSLVVPNTLAATPFSAGASRAGVDHIYTRFGNFSIYNGGTNSGFTLNSSDFSGTGSVFGISGGDIYLNNTPSGEVYTPNTTWTWLSKDLNAVGQGSLTSTPITVYTASNGETVSFALIPEPSSAILLGFGLLLLNRRNRK